MARPKGEKAMTVAERMKKHRAIKKGAGWHEVRVWLPTKADAEAVRAFAETFHKSNTAPWE